MAQRMFSAADLEYQLRLVSGVQELRALKGHVVDGIGHFDGSDYAYEKLTLALAKFCMLGQTFWRNRL